MAIDTRLFDRNELFGITRVSHYDEDNDTFTIETFQDCDVVIEANKRQYNATDERAKHGDGLAHYATIPLAVLEDLQQKGIYAPGKTNIYHDGGKRFRKWLNDSDNRFFRTRPGRV